jgi:hypothetical protein
MNIYIYRTVGVGGGEDMCSQQLIWNGASLDSEDVPKFSCVEATRDKPAADKSKDNW